MWCLRTLSDDIFAPQTTLIVKLHKNSLYYDCYNHSNTARAALACYHDAQGQYITHNVSLGTAAVLTQHPYIQPETPAPVSKSKPYTQVWKALLLWLPSRNADCDFWWGFTGPHLAAMLEAAGYPTEKQTGCSCSTTTGV